MIRELKILFVYLSMRVYFVRVLSEKKKIFLRSWNFKFILYMNVEFKFIFFISGNIELIN